MGGVGEGEHLRLLQEPHRIRLLNTARGPRLATLRHDLVGDNIRGLSLNFATWIRDARRPFLVMPDNRNDKVHGSIKG